MGVEQLHVEQHTETGKRELNLTEEAAQEITDVDDNMEIVSDSHHKETVSEKFNKLIAQTKGETSEKEEESDTNEAQSIVEETESPGAVVSSAEYLRSQGKDQKY